MYESLAAAPLEGEDELATKRDTARDALDAIIAFISNSQIPEKDALLKEARALRDEVAELEI